ncbi:MULTISPECIES: hypothetical protein [unclassified Brevundimonas]|uniref:hypothetical protein n=1 Tax=unclassified Brevundimonas TaxID=2622653 RepID=UPI0025C12BDE|nr:MULTISPECIES: hypothetical protein [unclassified Brevundimonas]
MRDSETRILQMGTTQGGRVGEWSWTLTGNYSRNDTETLSDIAGRQAFRETSRAVNSRANSDLLLSGPMLQLPAGPLSATMRAGFEAQESRNSSNRPDLASRNTMSRETGVVQGSVTLPVFGIGQGQESRLAALSVNANFNLEKLSDFGTLQTYGYGLNWSPLATINLIASATHEEGAPRWSSWALRLS